MSTTDDIAKLQAEVAALKRQSMPAIGDPRAFTSAQLRAESAYACIGDSAPPPLAGETILPYRRRLLERLKPLSARWRAVPIDAINDAVALGAIEADIFADAQREASKSTHFKEGELHPITRADQSGRPITRYVGHPSACWDQFNPPTRFARDGLNSFRTRDSR